MFNSTEKAGKLFSQKKVFFKKLIFCMTILMSLSCSIVTNASQSPSRQAIDNENINLLENKSKNNLSYIGDDGNIWVTNEDKELKVTDFIPKSKELPISFYSWSPDGKKIAVQANSGIYIFIITPQGIDKYFLGSNSFLLGGMLQYWSPDSKKILTSQLGLKTLDLWEITNDGKLETKPVIKPLPVSGRFIWLPDSKSFAMSVDWLENIGTETICSGSGTKIKISIIDTQVQSENIIYEGWGTSFDVFANKIVIIGGDDGCTEFPLVYDLEKSEMLRFSNAISQSGLCFGDHIDNVAIFTVSSLIDASQSILLLNTDSMSYDNIEFGEISEITDFKSNCKGYFWSKDKQTLYFNSDLFWGGEITQVDIKSNKMYPLAGDKQSEPRFVFDLPNAQVAGILDDGNILISGGQNGQANALYYANLETFQIKRLGNAAFWAFPFYFGQSQTGLLVIQATDIQTQLTNIYWVNLNGDVLKTIFNASQPNWQSVE